MPCVPLLSFKNPILLAVNKVRNGGIGASHKTKERADWLSSVSILGKGNFGVVAASVWMELLLLLTLEY